LAQACKGIVPSRFFQMHQVLATLEAFHAGTLDVFDRIEAACNQAESQLGAVEERLARAAARIDHAAGSTCPLTIESARVLETRQGAAARCAERLFDDDLLAALADAAPISDGHSQACTPPTAATAAEDFNQIIKVLDQEHREKPGWSSRGAKQGNFIPPHGRLSSLSELFLFNSPEEPYKGRLQSDNLANVDDVGGMLATTAVCRKKEPGDVHGNMPTLNLETDEPDPLLEDLRFRPRPTIEVTLNLPESLPNLGGPVANIVWNQQDQAGGETEKPLWDALPTVAKPAVRVASQPTISAHHSLSSTPTAASAISEASAAPARPAVPSLFQRPPGPPAAKVSLSSQQHPTQDLPTAAVAAPAAAAPPPLPAPAPVAPSAATTPPVALAAGKGAPPPPPAGKGASKGKSKGQAPPPPPPRPPTKSLNQPAPKSSLPSSDTGKSAMLAAIRTGATLRKVGPPKQRSAANVGRVVS